MLTVVRRLIDDGVVGRALRTRGPLRREGAWAVIDVEPFQLRVRVGDQDLDALAGCLEVTLLDPYGNEDPYLVGTPELLAASLHADGGVGSAHVGAYRIPACHEMWLPQLTLHALVVAFDELFATGLSSSDHQDCGPIVSSGDLTAEPYDGPLRRDGDWLVAEVAGYEVWMFTEAQETFERFTNGLRVQLRSEGEERFFWGRFHTSQQATAALSTEGAHATAYEFQPSGVLVAEPTVACVLAAVRRIIADGVVGRAFKESEPHSEPVETAGSDAPVETEGSVAPSMPRWVTLLSMVFTLVGLDMSFQPAEPGDRLLGLGIVLLFGGGWLAAVLLNRRRRLAAAADSEDHA